MTPPAAILFDLGGVLMPFDRERRVRAIVAPTGAAPEAVRAIFDGDLPLRLDLGEVDESHFADAFSELAGRPVSRDEARGLILSVFEPPNLELWALARRLGETRVVGALSDNPAFVRDVLPDPAALDPLIFSADIRAAKPSDAAFAAAEARLGLSGAAILFIDDSAANVVAARRRGWDAVQFTSNDQLLADLAGRGLP